MARFRWASVALVTVTCIGAPSWTLAQETSSSHAVMDSASVVNMAGRQRMLAQRAVKAYLLVGQEIDTDRARTELGQSVQQFESQLATLKGLAPNATLGKPLADLSAAWALCKPLLVAPPSKTGADTLYDLSESLQTAAHRVALAYRDAGTGSQEHVVNLAGRQRMLLQRMAKFYLYRAWGIRSEAADMELHLSRAHFTTVLIQLESSPLATAQSTAQLAQLRRDWAPYQTLLFASRNAAQMRKDAPRVVDLAERARESSEKLVALVVEMAQGAPR